MHQQLRLKITDKHTRAYLRVVLGLLCALRRAVVCLACLGLHANSSLSLISR